ncbi:lysosomal acid glucosylceramidase-like [Belonocnema kinseyi]|uniref:lysosomal acid glucosylceramidase-like n=1 Tax=Belonocnema kinseyi TaxID=2817044 RepID=UPI00143CCD2E|nr:lysosomal acid glucosylceramidase-like [Belonocnema kinseyi]
MILPILIFSSFVIQGYAEKCIYRSFGGDSVVCVCNSTYCDSTPVTDTPEKGTYLWYMSNQFGKRMFLTKGKMKSSRVDGTIITLNRNIRYQKILGFGGSFSDATGINILSISKASQEKLLESYFGINGSRYNIGRVPIGGSDFSTRPYTLDDVDEDTDLQYFSLTEEDFKYKIPMIKWAKALNPNLQLLAVAWTAPAWMKSLQKNAGFGILEPKYYQSYSEYLLKFLKAYKKHDLNFWGISSGNEPTASVSPLGNILPNMGWIPNELANWIAYHLGPTLASSNCNETRILILDDQRANVPWFVDQTFGNHNAKKYVSGIAVHYYMDIFVSPNVLDQAHEKYPDKFILMSEACMTLKGADICLGCWSKTELYILEIFENLNHWAIGWVDWNLALNKIGGPTYIKNYVNAAIIVDEKRDEFYKLPLYYAIHHFSRFVCPGSVRINVSLTNVPLFDAITAIAFETPSKETIVLLYNKNNEGYKVAIEDGEEGFINIIVPPYSLNTIVYRR